MISGWRLVLFLYGIAAALWAFSGKALEYPAFGAALLELFVAAWLFPAARFELSAPLSPRNWALFLFHVNVVLTPLLGFLFGFERGVSERLPSPSFVNAAILLSALSHFCFALGAQLAHKTQGPVRHRLRFSSAFEASLGGVFVCLGVAALWFTFGSLGGYLRYVTLPETQIQMTEAPTTVRGALGTFLRPFLPFGLILLWSNGIAARATTGGRGRYVLPTLLLLAALLPATFNYNRASMVGPVLAILAAYSLKVQKLSTRAVLLAGVGILLFALPFGAYRNPNPGSGGPVGARNSILQDANGFFQIYGEGPQFLGLLLEQTEREPLHLGRTLWASLVYPVPVLGKPFREGSGVHFYNRLIYGRSGIVDQVIPASGELMLNFHLAGVVVVFAMLGFVIQRIQAVFHAAQTAFSAAASFYLGMWVSFPIAGSLQVLSQALLYNMWPVYAYYGLRALLGACLPTRAHLAAGS
jgi:hypothetical protein